MYTIYDYFEDIYFNHGIDAQTAEEQRVWDMYKNNPEQFAMFIEEYHIDLNAYLPYEYTFTAFEQWCEEMEG